MPRIGSDGEHYRERQLSLQLPRFDQDEDDEEGEDDADDGDDDDDEEEGEEDDKTHSHIFLQKYFFARSREYLF